LLFSICLFIVINLIRILDYLSHPQIRGLSIFITFSILIFFIFLFWLSKQGKTKLAASLLIIIYSLPMFYSFIIWGTDLPAGLMLAVLIITLSGILLGERLALVSTFIISAFLIILTDCQYREILTVRNYWRNEKTEVSDAIVYASLLLIIAIIAYIFCRNIRKSLIRAQKSEAALKEERDSLEIKVIERTNQLKQAEIEKINQLYRLAEFGRLSSGIFHDLINPLTAISLNLEQVKDNGKNEISGAKSYLGQAILATHKMEDMIGSIKRQIQREDKMLIFILNEEIKQIINILAYKARQANVVINFIPTEKIELFGDPVKFGQIILNLLANAIEASESAFPKSEKEVKIEIKTDDNNVYILVSDQGSGISQENISRIFEPFFSTKTSTGRGLGIGLSSTKNIIEKSFRGSISVDSGPGLGSQFLVSLPAK